MSEELSPRPGKMELMLHRGEPRKAKVRCALCLDSRKVRRRSFEGAIRLLLGASGNACWSYTTNRGYLCPGCTVFAEALP